MSSCRATSIWSGRCPTTGCGRKPRPLEAAGLLLKPGALQPRIPAANLGWQRLGIGEAVDELRSPIHTCRDAGTAVAVRRTDRQLFAPLEVRPLAVRLEHSLHGDRPFTAAVVHPGIAGRRVVPPSTQPRRVGKLRRLDFRVVRAVVHRRKINVRGRGGGGLASIGRLGEASAGIANSRASIIATHAGSARSLGISVIASASAAFNAATAWMPPSLRPLADSIGIDSISLAYLTPDLG